MIRSMTGFGRGVARTDLAEVTVELRAVNGRFAEVSMRTPRELSARENEIVSRLKTELERGKVTASVNLRRLGSEAVNLRVDTDVARAYAGRLEELRAAAGIEAPITLEMLLRFPDVMTTGEAEEEDDKDLWNTFGDALTAAIEELQTMRSREGEAIATDSRMRINIMEDALDAVARRAPQRLVEARERMSRRLEELLSDPRFNAERLEAEAALLADRLDITEEIVRLRAHFDAFVEALDADEPVGRRLDFILQEMNRETNTVGSKANDAEIAQAVVSMKEELERLREQIQNVV